MPSKTTIIEKFKTLKNSSSPLVLQFQSENGHACHLELMTSALLSSSAAGDIALLAKWREGAADAFPAQFAVTIPGTKTWCEKALINAPERLLFWVIDGSGKKIGHVGLFRISEDGQHIEADNIVRGEVSSSKGLMFRALEKLLSWQRQELAIPKSFLRVFADNEKAIALYKKLGYYEIQRAPLRRVQGDGRIDWQEIVQNPYEPALRYFMTMEQRAN